MPLNRRAGALACLLGALVLASACDGTSEEIEQARKLAEMGQSDLAITKVEQIVADHPELAPAYDALGDIHMKEALANPRAGAEHAKKAAEAWAGAAKLSNDARGTLRAKRALALALAGDAAEGAKVAKDAWTCCKNPAVLSFTKDSDVVLDVLRSGSWTFESWQQHPAFQASAVATRTRYVAKATGAPVLPLDGQHAVRTLDPFSTGSADSQTDGFLQFVDHGNPEPIPHEGYVTANSCRTSPRAGAPCEVGRQVGGREPYIYAGPCWWTGCNPGEARSERVDLRSYQRGSATCVGGPIVHKSDFTGEETCTVTYNTLESPSRRIPIESVWLLPSPDGFRSPNTELKLASEAGLPDVADKLADGQMAIGMPRPIASWALTGKQSIEVTEAGIVETSATAMGTFTFTNGILTRITAADSTEDKPARAAPAEDNAAKRAECPGNLDGIKTALLAYDAAFDSFVSAERLPRAQPTAETVSWGGGNEGFNKLGWAPDGPVRGVYWVQLSPDGRDFEAHALCDVDGDGTPAHYVATKMTNARALTDSTIF